MESRVRIGVRDPGRPSAHGGPGALRKMGPSGREEDDNGGGIYVTPQARPPDHFLRRLEERGGDIERLVWEGDSLAAAGWLTPIHRQDYNFVVPGFGQIRLRLDRHGRGFVAVTFLPVVAC